MTQKTRWTETDKETEGSREAERAKRRKNKMPLAKNSTGREKKWHKEARQKMSKRLGARGLGLEK